MENKKTISGGATLWARQTIDSDIFRNKPAEWFKIWFYLVNRVNWKTDKQFERGELFLKYDYISSATNTTKNQIDHFIRWAKKCKMLATQKTTRGMILKIANYSKYQTLDNYYFDIKSDTESETEAKQKRNKSDTILKKEKKDKKEKNNNTLRAELADDDQQNVLSKEDQEKEQLQKDIQELITIFYEKINPNINFGNSTTRKACEFLIKKYGIEVLKRTTEYAISIQGDPYAPVITTPYQLKEKLSQLIIFKNKQKNLESKKDKTIIGL